MTVQWGRCKNPARSNKQDQTRAHIAPLRKKSLSDVPHALDLHFLDSGIHKEYTAQDLSAQPKAHGPDRHRRTASAAAVSGLTMTSAVRQSLHSSDSHAQKRRSAAAA
jgi:hypothetical protein